MNHWVHKPDVLVWAALFVTRRLQQTDKVTQGASPADRREQTLIYSTLVFINGVTVYLENSRKRFRWILINLLWRSLSEW